MDNREILASQKGLFNRSFKVLEIIKGSSVYKRGFLWGFKGFLENKGFFASHKGFCIELILKEALCRLFCTETLKVPIRDTT